MEENYLAIVMYWQQKNIKNSSRSTAFSDKILTKELQQMMTGGIDNGKGIDQPGKICAGRRRDEKLGEYAQNYGKKALILISKGGYKRIGAMVEKSFEGKECGYVFDYFNGECSKKKSNVLEKS